MAAAGSRTCFLPHCLLFFVLSDKTLLLQEDDEVAIRWGANEDMRWKIWKMRKYEKKIKDEKMMRINQHL